MTEIALPHIIYGRKAAASASPSPFDILAISDNLNPELLPTTGQPLPVDPMPAASDRHGQTVAWLCYLTSPQPQYMLVRTHWQTTDPHQPVTQLIYIPTAALRYAGDDLQLLLRLVEEPLPHYEGSQRTIPALRLSVPSATQPEQRIALLEQQLSASARGNPDLLLAVLGGAIAGQVVIRNYEADWHKRARLVSSIMQLLPAPVRPHLTFSTHSDNLDQPLPRITFSETAADATCEIDWTNPQLPASLLEHPYVALLRSCWQGNASDLPELLRTLDNIAYPILDAQPVWDGLSAVALRYQYDQSAQLGEYLPVDTLLSVLDSSIPPQAELRLHYLEQLFRRALEDRDASAACRTAQAMDSDPQVEQALEPMLSHALEFQPDAAYFFARARLTEGLNPKWMGRLRRAAQQALDVAIASDDPALIASWLTLISREPLRYELIDVLRSGILAAREHVSGNPSLALDLLVLGVKRQPDTLPVLLEDQALCAALPDAVQSALIDFDPSALENLARLGREIFLLAITRAVQNCEDCISERAIRSLWEIHTQQQTNTLPPQVRPLAIMQNIAHDDRALQAGALLTLLALMLADRADRLFLDVSAILAGRSRLLEALPDACIASGRPLDELFPLIGSLHNEGTLTPQQVIDLQAALLRSLEWDDQLLPHIEQLARLLNLHPETMIEVEILWKLAEISGELKSEQMLRVSMRRLFHHIAELPSENQVVDTIARLRKATLWSTSGRTILIRWWRQYVRSQHTAQLQKLERVLESKRLLEEFCAVVQTALALRRVMGQRTLEEFAQDIHTTYSLLQSLAQGFDPDERQSPVDSATIRLELESRADSIAPDSRHILAANLKELAQLIMTLAENRSKPSIIRSEDVLERQLMMGEHQPQSALDVMRWLSGFFDGFQKDDLDK